MGKRRNGFTEEQHKRVGMELAWVRDRLSNLHCCIQRAYGVGRGAKTLHRAINATRAVDALRDSLEDWVAKETGVDTFNVHIYYPGSSLIPVEKPLTYQEMDENELQSQFRKAGIM